MEPLIPRDSRKSDRTVRPEPLGAQRMMSLSLGLEAGLLLVGDLETVREVEGVGVGHLVLDGGVDRGAGGVESRSMAMVAFSAASSMGKRFLPGCQPSSMASFHEARPFGHRQ